MAEFKKFVFTPPGSKDVFLAITACRAGGIGILNAELGIDSDLISCQLDFLSQKAGNGYGLKIFFPDEVQREIVDGYARKGLRWLILDSETIQAYPDWIGNLRQNGVRVLTEVSSLIWPTDPQDEVIDGLVLKGSESGGFISENSSFILVQRWLGQTNLPLYLRGGLTPHVAAACHAVGLAGGIFDSQVLLLEESPFALNFASLLENLSGSETVAVGNGEDGSFFRLLVRPGHHAAQAFAAQGKAQLPEMLRDQIDWQAPGKGLLPIGQDICFAGRWRKEYGSMAQLFRAVDSAIENSLHSGWKPLSENSPLAESMGIHLPLVQGPMSRVSDNPEFALSISREGALPVLAFALNRAERLDVLMKNTVSALGNRPWGIGLLGFAPHNLLDEQLTAAKKYHPRMAVIAGGRPDQVAMLEKLGLITFLHVPSANLIPLFLQEGARRFIFEGRECGGHIGPLNAFVLWSTMVDALMSELRHKKISGTDIEVLFAGGIHDAASSAIVQVIAGPLAGSGVKIGFIMGSAYLFTDEIVRTGAITPIFQQEIIKCQKTVSLESGPGHASRCAYTPFARSFFLKRAELSEKGVSAGEIRKILDELILGRLRIAAKGRGRILSAKRLQEFDEKSQVSEGMYMVGQLAALRSQKTDVAALHRAVVTDAETLLFNAFADRKKALPKINPAKPADIAIIGMACFLPKAGTIAVFWENILTGIEAITEVPPHRWDWRLYYDQNRQAKDKIYSKWGGFLDDLPFDPTRYGMPPKSIASVDPMQLMALEIARRTLSDAGYENKNFDREHTSVIIGASGGAGDVGMQYGLRAELPRFQGCLTDSVAQRLPEWSEDTFAGILLNVTAGRIANRLNLGGVNHTVDAACASSLAAVYHGIGELTSGRSGLVIAGGVDTVQGPFGYLCFSKTQALSPRGRCRTFDAESDGIVISEGIAMVALKRLEDAERDSDRIYAVIKGIGGSSDGRAKGLTAPSPAGQMKAMTRAYYQAGFEPDTVDLFEAHGTGTVAGDTAELEGAIRLLKVAGAMPRQSAIGSVKTLIGHTKATAGVVGLIKATLALHRRVLPPHFGVKEPNRVLQKPDCPFHITDAPMPWPTLKDRPRRAAVSSFGFGGTNFHAVLEEYAGEYRPWLQTSALQRWPSELILWSGADRDELMGKLNRSRDQLKMTAGTKLRDIANTLAGVWQAGGNTLAVVAADTADLMAKMDAALDGLRENRKRWPPGIYYRKTGDPNNGKVALLFSGQGSQYPEMFRELAVNFPVFTDTLSEADTLMAECFAARFGEGVRLSHFIYPRGTYGEEAKGDATRALTATDIAQPALGAVEAALWHLMRDFGLKVDMAGGHSYGEFVALYAAGFIDFNSLMSISEARGRLIVDAAKDSGKDLGEMASVKASRDDAERALSDIEDLVIANHNAPLQTIVSGSAAAIEAAVKRITDAEGRIIRIPVAAAFHSGFVEPARAALADLLAKTEWKAGNIAVFSNTTGELHSKDTDTIRITMTDHLVRPVEFVTEIEAMYRNGARIFLEMGPRSVLTGLVGSILEGRPHKAISVDANGRGITGMLHAFAQLICSGVALNVADLFKGRDCLKGDPADLISLQHHEPVPEHAWLLNGSCARRVVDPVRQTGVRLEDIHSAPKGKSENEPRLLPKPGEPVSNIPLEYQNHRKEEIHMNGRRQTAAAGDSPVMATYFETMRHFLETQERVMTMYLGGSPAVRHSRSQATVHRPQKIPHDRSVSGRMASLLPSGPPDKPEPGNAGAPAPVEKTLIRKVQEEMAEPAKESGSGKGSGADNIDQDKMAELSKKSGGGNSSKADTIDQKKMEEILLSIVEERTGYPRDMLGMEQDLEAELGIDSIKRVEIVGALLKELPGDYGQKLGEDRGALNTRTTLKAMLDMLQDVNNGGDPQRPFDPAETGSTSGNPVRPFRHVIRPRQEPIAAAVPNWNGNGRFLITQDKLGVAEKLLEALSARSCTVTLIPHDVLADEDRLNTWSASSATDTETIDGIVHLAPLGADPLPADASLNDWRRQLQLNEKSIFLLLRNFSSSIKMEANLLSASALGGFFGRSSGPFSGFSLQGGTVGLLKSLYEERPRLKVKAIDVDPSQPVDAVVVAMMDELALDGGRQEVGYPRGKRTIFQTVPEPLDEEKGNPGATGNLVILATGGLRGITAELLRELAKPGNTFILTGRTPFPEDESDALHSLKTPSDLRNHFISLVHDRQFRMTPADIGQKINRILSAREMRSNRDDFLKRGAAVEYHAVDVTNADEISSLLNGVYDRHGEIGGVLHGAGVIEDKLLADKTGESWSRVVETKVMGLLLLQKYLRSDNLRFFTVLSSVAGRYGNSGQTDYATANELMNRLCCQLNRKWENRVNVKALCWGPWGPTMFGTGMVTKETEAKFAEKKVCPVRADAGRRAFIGELTRSAGTDVEIICGEGPWEERESEIARIKGGPALSADTVPGLLLHRATLTAFPEGDHSFSLCINDHHAYLLEHCIDTVPVLPAAAAVEMMAEAAAHLWPDRKVVEIRNFQLLKGIELKDGNGNLSIRIDPPVGNDNGSFVVNARICSEGKTGEFRNHYRSVLGLAQQISPSFRHRPKSHAEEQLSVRRAYNEWLFHGPRFQVIEAINGLSRTGARAALRTTLPAQWLNGIVPEGRQWLFDPAVIDAAAQMAILYARMFFNETTLPAAFGRVVRYCEVLPGQIVMHFERIPPEESHLVRANVCFSDADDNVLMMIENMECISSAALNRLGGTFRSMA